MSCTLETLNRGPVQDFGFYGPDISRVRLSDDLPPLSLSQFCEFSAEILVAAYKGSDPKIKGELQELFLQAQARVRGLLIRPSPETERSDVVSSNRISGAIEEDKEVGLDVRVTEYSEELKQELAKSSKLTPELVERLAAAVGEAHGYSSQNYLQTPFEFRSGIVKIGGKFDVDLLEFTHFATRIMTGGSFEWPSDYGVPECAGSAIKKLADEVSS